MTHGLDAALIGYLISASFVTVLFYPYQWIHVAFIVALNNIAKKQLLESAGRRECDEPKIASPRIRNPSFGT